MKYSKKTIIDYINGNDILDYDIDDLENDYKFMIEVIKYSKDKNMYNLCSDCVKNNYEFVKFMIDFFCDDKELVVRIVDDYLKTISIDDIRYKELLIILSDIISYEDELDLGLKYSIKRSAFYELERVDVSIIEKLRNGNSGGNYSLGFYNTLVEYASSKIVTDYFAKRMVEEIFYNNNLNFEELIHSQFKDCNDIKKMGLNNYIVKYVGSFDRDLSDYIHANIDLVSSIRKELERVIANWDSYLNRVNRDKIGVFYEEVADTFKKYDNMLSFSYDEVINYVMNKLGLFDFFEKYDSLDDEIYDKMGEDYKNYLKKVRYSDNLLEGRDLDLNELKCVRDCVAKAKKIFGSDVIDRISDDYYDDNVHLNGGQPEIIEVDFNNHRKKGS